MFISEDTVSSGKGDVDVYVRHNLTLYATPMERPTVMPAQQDARE